MLPVVERQFAATHEAMAAELIHRPRHVLYFDAGNDPGGEGLVPVEPPQGTALAISYLYGGGFLNPSWGARKLAMLNAVEELCAGADRVVRLASGQQVDSGWLQDLDPADAELLRRFELWGARDDVSAEALTDLGAWGPSFNGGDDAVGILTATDSAAAAERSTDRIEVNVHFAEHEWVTDQPDAVREFDVRLLTELSRHAGRPLRVRPLLPSREPPLDERPGLERFAAACAESGIELTEPCVLRPRGIDEQVADLGRAAFTISSSYHVALTSLLLAIPSALLRDNGYYAQKARGLLADFGLPAEFAPRSGDDPVATAAAIAPHLFDPQVSGQIRRRLEAAAYRVRQRRIMTEARLMAAIADGAVAVAGSSAPVPPAAPPSSDAERRAAESEAKLEEVLGSRSWRITAPLRRLTSSRGR